MNAPVRRPPTSSPHRITETDRAIHRHLQGCEAAAPRDVVRAVGASRSTVSHRLGLLAAAGHAIREGESWSLRYRVGPVPLPEPVDERRAPCATCGGQRDPGSVARAHADCGVCRRALRAAACAEDHGIEHRLLVAPGTSRVRACDPEGRTAWLDVPADVDWLRRELELATRRGGRGRRAGR